MRNNNIMKYYFHSFTPSPMRAERTAGQAKCCYNEWVKNNCKLWKVCKESHRPIVTFMQIHTKQSHAGLKKEKGKKNWSVSIQRLTNKQIFCKRSQQCDKVNWMGLLHPFRSLSSLIIFSYAYSKWVRKCWPVRFIWGLWQSMVTGCINLLGVCWFCR